MPKINVEVIKTEEAVVEVSYAEMWKHIKKKLWPKDSYISGYGGKKNQLMVYDYTHPHNNDDIYECKGDASEEEITLYNAISIISEELRKK